AVEDRFTPVRWPHLHLPPPTLTYDAKALARTVPSGAAPMIDSLDPDDSIPPCLAFHLGPSALRSVRLRGELPGWFERRHGRRARHARGLRRNVWLGRRRGHQSQLPRRLFHRRRVFRSERGKS